MLFNSIEFLFFFFPLSVIVYRLLLPRSFQLALLWIIFASVFFYGWWNPAYLLLLALSLV